jgi:hypothetical protein
VLDLLQARLQEIIAAAGADYLGEQDRLVLFQSRVTGATLALSIGEVLEGGAYAVCAHVKESDARYQ